MRHQLYQNNPVIFIHHDSVVVLTTRHTATGWVFATFFYPTVTGGDVSTLLAVFVSAGERKKERKKRVRDLSAGLKNRRREKKKMTHRNGARKARERVPTRYTHAHRATQPIRVETSKRRFQTSRRNAFPQHLRSHRQVPGLFPTFFRRENPRARARSSPPANATAALYPSRDLRTRTKTNDDERRRVKQKRYYSQVRRHPRVTLLL